MHTSRRKTKNGTALLVVVLLISLGLGLGVIFLRNSSIFLSLGGFLRDSVSSDLKRDSAEERALAILQSALQMTLNSRLQFVNSPAMDFETFQNISNEYAVSTTKARQFLDDLIVSKSFDGGGTQDPQSPFANVENILPTNWTQSSDGYSEYKITVNTLLPQVSTNPQEIRFEYEISVQSRAYGKEKFTKSESKTSYDLKINVRGAPFSQWSLFMQSMKNQNGDPIAFIGGDSSSEIQEVYSGPVHINERPYFLGHPTFSDVFKSGDASANWVYQSAINYTGCPSQCPTFASQVGGAPTISMPTQIFNMLRLAGGDTSTTATTNMTQPSTTEIVSWLATHATGSLSGSTLPDGIYIPVDNFTEWRPTGGVFVQGDANIELDVVQGSGDFSGAQWGHIDTADQICKFQKFKIDSAIAGVHTRDVYVGADEGCDVTYVFDFDSPGSSPAKLVGRPAGNIHVEGRIDKLGGVSRLRPAVARDFALNISATKDIRIFQDLQYEDALYVEVSGSTLGSTIVANPTGEVGGSGFQPTSADVAATIDSESKTVLGIVSMHRNVYVHLDAPDDLNLHAAIYAGTSDAFNSATGFGCGAAGAPTAGCGFGYEGWNIDTSPVGGKGNLKILGSVSAFKTQSLGIPATPTDPKKGYGARYIFDSRLKGDVTPPAFPVSNQPQVYVNLEPVKTWRISKFEDQ